MDPWRVLRPIRRRAPIVAHVPHASTWIPGEFRRQLLLDDAALTAELVRMTDWHTDRLFDALRELGASIFVNRMSRLVVDPERFMDDVAEPAARHGQGAVYTHTSDDAELRRPNPAERQELIDRVYLPYHAALTDLVAEVVAEFGSCLILDCHSFSTAPLRSEADQRPDRPDVCIGTDAFHTPARLAERFMDTFSAEGWLVQHDRPFTGALVPQRYYGKDERVTAVMIEVRRGIYCDETTGAALPRFDEVRASIQRALSAAL